MFSVKFPARARSVARLSFATFTSFFGLMLCAQQGAVPTIGFTCDFPGSVPSHYEISVAADGQGSYFSQTKPGSDTRTEAPDSSNNDYRATFTLPTSTVTRILDLAKRSNYFAGDIDSRKRIASTGTKTLSYHSSIHNVEATYNYSTAPGVQDLTSMFQGLSETMEFVRRLSYDLQYQKLALDDELKRMEEMASQGALQQVSVATTVLEKIADDPAIMNVSRARAQRLLAGEKAAR
jgi:hypothetical protein